MKILHMMGGGDVGGAKTHIMSIILALKERGHEVHLVSFRDGAFPKEAQTRGIPVTVIEHVRPLKCKKALLACIRAFRPDILHCHGAKANLMGAMVRRACKLPVMTTVHSDYRLDYLGSPLKQWTRGTVNAISLRFLDYYQPVADRMARTLIERGFNPERMVTIYNGMDFGNPVPAFDRQAYISQKWGVQIEEGAVLAGIAARLTAVKDVATAIRGFAKAYASAPHLWLFVAGEGEDEEMLRRLAKHLQVAHRVVFCGWVTEMPQFLACLDINLLTSLSETFPYSILEGVREHCATICSDVGGMPDLITSGENGFIFPPKEDGMLANYLTQLAQDATLRKTFANRLYEKASIEFSLARMCETQIQNYQKALVLFHRPKQAKDGIVICGAYGKGNAGDDAILKAIVQEMRELDPTRSIWVMSRRPKETKLLYRTNAMYTFHVPKILSRLRRSALYINGGGSLMQDITSTRSLQYYLYTLRAAKKAGCKVMMYGCGIGPIQKEHNRIATAKTINASVDLITLRDDLSRNELSSMGITKPEIRLSADPTIILKPASREAVDACLAQMGIDPSKRYIGFGLRNWKGLEEAIPEIVKLAEYAYQMHGLIPMFIPIEYPSDVWPAEQVAQKLRCPYQIIRIRQPIETTIGIFARMETMVGIRLHSLMFSAGHGVPVLGMSYDIKVDGFLKYIGSRTCIPLSKVKAEAMIPLLDACVSGQMNTEVQKMAILLKEREGENTKGAKKLLGMTQ